MTTYETRFNLEAPVLNISDANRYLRSDDMTKYLREEIEYLTGKDNSRPDRKALGSIEPTSIKRIEWLLETDDSGRIRLDTEEPLSKEQLKAVSSWISGQNSDGLGEGFEQQDFASYLSEEFENYDPEWDEDYYDNDDAWVMASFDWKTNDYELEEI